MTRRLRSMNTSACSLAYQAPPSRGCARLGANRRTMPTCATARSASARKNSASFWSRCRPIAARSAQRRADYHDPLLPPRHALVAFGLWLQHVAKVDALVHMGAHGTLEWLPGKAIALTAECFPEIVTGALPVIYPFIVSNPGEAAQAKRRIAALTIGHLPPPLVGWRALAATRASSSNWSMNMPKPTASTGGGASGWRR